MYPVIIRILKINCHSPEYAALLARVPDIEEKARGQMEMRYADLIAVRDTIAKDVPLDVLAAERAPEIVQKFAALPESLRDRVIGYAEGVRDSRNARRFDLNDAVDQLQADLNASVTLWKAVQAFPTAHMDKSANRRCKALRGLLTDALERAAYQLATLRAQI